MGELKILKMLGSYMKGKSHMKFAVRFVLLAIFALALSVGLVSAQEEGSESLGGFVQPATSFIIEENDPGTFNLTLTGVAGTTPIILSTGTSGNFNTAEFLADWTSTGLSARAVIRFQMGNPLEADEDGIFLYDFTLVVDIMPVAEYEDGTVVYNGALAEVLATGITGTSPSEIELVEISKPVDALNLFWEEGGLEGAEVTVVITATGEFIEAISAARVTRLEGARPSGVSGSCIPNVTC